MRDKNGVQMEDVFSAGRFQGYLEKSSHSTAQFHWHAERAHVVMELTVSHAIIDITFMQETLRSNNMDHESLGRGKVQDFGHAMAEK